MFKSSLKKIVRCLFGDYSLYYIYSFDAAGSEEPGNSAAELTLRPVEKSELPASEDSPLAQQFGYFGVESRAFACFQHEKLVGLCFYWYGDRYRQRNFWPLAEKEAKLVQIVVTPEARGRGVATALISHSASSMAGQGFRRLYARIWHSNTPSLRAFERAGWERVALVVTFNPFRTAHPIRLTRRYR